MNKSHLIAAGLALAITAWVGGGYLLNPPAKETGSRARASQTKAPMTVAVRTQDAQAVEQHVISQGHTEPNRSVTVRAETAGQIGEVLADEGDQVAGGDVIARIKPGDRAAALERAKARVRETEAAYKASEKLDKQGFQTKRKADQAFSALQTAKAELEQARVEMQHLGIEAPFQGVITTSRIELGSFVPVNGEVMTIVDNSPLVVVVRIPQQDISRVKTGQRGTVSFATGQQREGTVRFVAAQADEQTRTFKVEIEVPNPKREIPSGISAEVKIPTGTVMAHFLSPAALSLNDEGVLGVKTVEDGETVAFHPAMIVRSGTNGVWITGLPGHARVITTGQGFVEVGERVQVAEDDSTPSLERGADTPARLSRAGIDQERNAQ